jgi:hypothetical protein
VGWQSFETLTLPVLLFIWWIINLISFCSKFCSPYCELVVRPGDWLSSNRGRQKFQFYPSRNLVQSFF